MACKQAHSALASCVILSSVSEEAHGSSLGEDAYLEYEQALKEVGLSGTPAPLDESSFGMCGRSGDWKAKKRQ